MTANATHTPFRKAPFARNLLCASVSAAILATIGLPEASAQQESEIEEVIVTGSFIHRSLPDYHDEQ